MRFPVEAPAVSLARDQKLLKPIADPVISDTKNARHHAQNSSVLAKADARDAAPILP
jgi:hypothetical protein